MDCALSRASGPAERRSSVAGGETVFFRNGTRRHDLDRQAATANPARVLSSFLLKIFMQGQILRSVPVGSVKRGPVSPLFLRGFVFRDTGANPPTDDSTCRRFFTKAGRRSSCKVDRGVPSSSVDAEQSCRLAGLHAGRKECGPVANKRGLLWPLTAAD